MAELQALELYDYALAQGVVVNQDDYAFDDGSLAPSETRECAVGDLQVRYYRLGEPAGLNTEAVVTVLQAGERLYEAVYDSFSAEGRPQDFALGLSDLSDAQSVLLQQAITKQREQSARETEVIAEAEPQRRGFASVLDSYVDRHGENAALVASVVALAQRGELFDTDPSDDSIVESYFHRVPNSTLIVNRVDTNGQYGLSRTFTVLDGDEPLFELGDSGQIEFNNLTPGQVETLQTAQLDGANPLLVNELYFQADLAQGLTNDGQAQARAILSQGDAITSAMVAELNDLMAAEEAIRTEDQSERGLVGAVRYPRFTEQELNRYLSTDTIARQLSAQSPVVEVQAVESLEQTAMQSVSDYLDATTPEAVGARVYATYYRWAERNFEREEPEAALVVNGYRVESLGNTIGSHDPMPFQVVEVATERVVMDFTLAEGRWIEQPQTEPGVQPEADYTSDTIVVNGLDERLKTQLVATFESPHKKAGLIASTYLNQSGQNVVSRPNGLVFQREYHEDGTLWRDLTFSADAVSIEGRAYAIAQTFPDGGGMGIGMPLSVERAINKEFAQLVAQYEQAQALSLDQGRPQVEVQKPPVAGYESETTNPHLEGKANVMVAVEAPVKAQTEIDLRDLMSVKTLSIMETGKVPQQRVEVDGKVQLVDRTPEEGLAMVARAAYGAQNFCQENKLPHTPATDLIAGAADRLSLNGPEVTQILASIEKAKCRPVMEVATHSQSGVWARIEEKYPEYAAQVPDAIKVERAMAQPAAAAKAVVAAATTRQVAPPVLKQKEAQSQLPSQFEMAVTVAAYNLQKEGVDRMGDDNPKAKVIFNKSKDGNISVINKADNTIIASRNAVTGQVVPGTLPEGQDYTKAYAAVVQMQTEKYTAKTTAPKAKAKAGDGR